MTAKNGSTKPSIHRPPPKESRLAQKRAEARKRVEDTAIISLPNRFAWKRTVKRIT